jgi:glyceraldehyde 3-phosphate dehydrogenase
MGLGQIGRHLYQLVAESDDIEIAVATSASRKFSTICSRATLSTHRRATAGQLSGCPKFRTRMLQIAKPGDVPLEVFGVDCVIDATGRYRRREYLKPTCKPARPGISPAAGGTY